MFKRTKLQKFSPFFVLKLVDCQNMFVDNGKWNDIRAKHYLALQDVFQAETL